MIEKVTRSIRYALMVALVVWPGAGVVSAQEGGEAMEDIQNVRFVFHLVQADGFNDEDPEISDVVTELRKLFNFQGYRLLSTSMLNIGLARAINTSTGKGSQRIVAGDSEPYLAISADVTARLSTGAVRAKVTLTDVTWGVHGNVPALETVPLLETSVTIRDGQRVVLGTARRTAEEPVLILVVTPRIDPK